MAKGSKITDVAAGAALASLELHRIMIQLLVIHKVIPRDVTIAFIDEALQRAEKEQMSGNAFSPAAAQAARLQIDGLLIALKNLPLP
jgi:hypothetical protein